MANNVLLVKGQHCLVLDNNQEIIRGENGGILVIDQISKYLHDIGKSLSELPLSPEVQSFFDICIIDKSNISEEMDKNNMSGMNSSCSNLDQNNSSSESSNSNAAVWDNKAVKLLFTLYADNKDAFKNTSVKNNVVWDKIKLQMNINGRYNFTRIQIKDKWMNMRKAYMRVKDHNKGTGVTPKTYRYYKEIDDLYGDKPNVNPVAIASNIRAEDENILSSDDSAIDDKPKKKKSKVERQISSWTEKFIQYSKEREQRHEARQAEKIIALENSTKTFREMMEKLIEKL